MNILSCWLGFMFKIDELFKMFILKVCKLMIIGEKII